ncbi:MAG: recombinase family protein [Dehalococcoidia bacterium]
MRAVGYFRAREDDKPLAEQSKTFLEFCRINGYEAAAVFLDAQTASAADGMPGFRQMVEFLRSQRNGGFIFVAVPDLAGLGNDLTESARRYFQLASLGASVLTMETGDDVGSELLRSWTAASKNGRLGEKVRAAMRQKAVKGEALGRPPYGYRVGVRRRLQVVAEEGSIVRYIFRLYLKDGLGIRRIARRLNEEEIHTRRGGLWSMVTVRDILRNRAYLGTYSRFGVRVPASHPPLISPDDFKKVQERLDDRRPKSSVRSASRFLLSGLAYCGDCGNKMIGVTRRQRWQRRSDGELRSALYRYYQCESRTNRSLCTYHTWRAEVLEGEVHSSLVNGHAEPPTSPNGDRTRIEAQAKQLRDKVRRLDRRLEQYLDQATSGRINDERLRALGLEVATEQLAAEESLAERWRQAQQQATEAQRRQHRRESLARAQEQWADLTFSERFDLLRDVVERVVVRDKSVEVSLRP